MTAFPRYRLIFAADGSIIEQKEDIFVFLWT